MKFNSLVLLGTLIVGLPAHSKITDVNSFKAKLASLSDDELEAFLLKNPDVMGSCKFSRPVGGTCAYRVRNAVGADICLTSHPTYIAVPVSVGNWASDTEVVASALTSPRTYFDSIRSRLVSFSTPKARALGEIRSMLSQPSNKCGIDINKVEKTVSKKTKDFTKDNVVFYKDPSSKEVVCSTKLFANSIFNNQSCTYEQKDQFLPNEMCRKLLSYLNKTESVEVKTKSDGGSSLALPAVSLASFNAEIAVDYAIQRLPSNLSLNVVAASQEVSFAEAVPAEILYNVVERTPAELATVDNQTLASFRKAIELAKADNGVSIAPDVVALNDSLNSNTAVKNLVSSANVQFLASDVKAVRNDVRLQADNYVATKVESAGFSRPAARFSISRACPQMYQAIMAAPVKSSGFSAQ